MATIIVSFGVVRELRRPAFSFKVDVSDEVVGDTDALFAAFATLVPDIKDLYVAKLAELEALRAASRAAAEPADQD